MSIIYRLGQQNPLLRRVRRHATMSVLFRQITAVPDRSAPGSTPLAPAITPVSAMDRLFPGNPLTAPKPALASVDQPLQASAEEDVDSQKDKDWARLQTIFNKHLQKQDTETADAAISQTAEPEQNSLSPAPLLADIQGNLSSDDSDLQPPIHEKAQSIQPDLQRAPLPDPTVAIPDPTATHHQQVPLQEAWPIQHHTNTKPAKPMLPVAPSSQTPPQQPDVAVSNKIEEALQHVPSARPTASSVPLILPNKARPLPIVESVQRAANRTEDEPESGQITPSTKPPTKTLDSKIAPLPADKHLPGQVNLPNEMYIDSVSDRTTPESHASVSPPVPPTIPTEIGPLPADLWRLIGETPPTVRQQIDTNRSEVAQSLLDPGKDQLYSTAVPTSTSSLPSPSDKVLFPEAPEETAASSQHSALILQPSPTRSPDPSPQKQSGLSSTIRRQDLVAESQSQPIMPPTFAQVAEPTYATRNITANAPTSINRKIQPNATKQPETTPEIPAQTPNGIIQPKRDTALSQPINNQSLTERQKAQNESNVQRIEDFDNEFEPVLSTLETAVTMPAEASNQAHTHTQPDIDSDELSRQVYQQLKRRLRVEWERSRGGIK